MKSAAKEFVGIHDFFSFAEKDKEDKSTKVLINGEQLKKEDELILIRVIVSHFFVENDQKNGWCFCRN